MSNKDGKMLIYDKTIADEHKRALVATVQKNRVKNYKI